MNLLTDNWIPVRRLSGGRVIWLDLGALLTKHECYEICLPRDDLELAAVQLLICIAQVLFTPGDLKELVDRIRKPISDERFNQGIKGFKNWFELEHPEHPFMQVRGVKASKKTPVYRLLPGLADATNSCFVNERGISESLCGGCAAIAIYNRSSNAPSFGGGRLGGFKPGLRGSVPITTLIQGRHLREMIWLNVLTTKYLIGINDQPIGSSYQMPTWVLNIERNSKIEAHEIGLFRGLFWQPALIELGESREQETCDLCGRNEVPVFEYFLTNQFGYTLNGTWPHPHSPTYLTYTNNGIQKQFASFKSSIPSWTQLARFVVKQSADAQSRNGQEPAPVILQVMNIPGIKRERITLSIGGYRNEPGRSASIAERRHETISLSQGWASDLRLINEMVQLGLRYKSALRSALQIFDEGIKDKKTKKKTHKGLGFSKRKSKYCKIGESQFYRYTDSIMQKALAEASFDDLDQLAGQKDNLRSAMKYYCISIFNEQTGPYLNDPELIKTMAVARRTLNKNLRELEPEKEEGGEP